MVFDSDYNLSGLITVKDIQKNEDHPNACKDENGRLRVAAAVGVAGDAFERSRELINSNVDVIVVDTAHGHSKGVLKAISKIKSLSPNKDIIEITNSLKLDTLKTHQSKDKFCRKIKKKVKKNS